MIVVTAAFDQRRNVLGAIFGDIVGSVHEYAATKTKGFELIVPPSTFTDDSVLTIAVAEWLLTNQDLVDLFHDFTDQYPDRGYGGMFRHWMVTRSREPYNSFGNGSAMRVSQTIFPVRASSARSRTSVVAR